MAHLVSILSIILALVLFPPAALAVVSNNAVPGDTAYPIKRFLEDRIYDVASLHPTTKAWFAAARSDRRFKEITILVTQGKSVSNTLNELVVQTDAAAKEITKVENNNQKKQLLDELQRSIEKYDQGLEKVSNQIIGKELASNQPQPTRVVESESPPPAVQQSTPKPTVPTSSPTSLPSSVPTLVPTPRSTPSIQPEIPPQSPQGGAEAKDIEEARKKLEEIQRAIEEERRRAEEVLRQQEQNRLFQQQSQGDQFQQPQGQQQRQQQSQSQPTYSPSPSPTPSLTPSRRTTQFKLFSVPEDSQNPSPTPTPSCVIPAKPSGLTYINDTKTVSWDAVASASYYNVRLVTPSSDQHNFDNITNTWYTFPKDLIVASGNYSWWVDAVNECGVDREGSSFTIPE